MKNLPRSVLWTEGMLIAPQHLQQQDAYHEAMRELRLRSMATDCWGVASVVLDGSSLVHDEVALHSVEVVFPGGTCAGWNVAEGMPALTRRIGAHFQPSKTKLDVYLAVARLREGVANTARDASTPMPHQRFVARRRAVAELHDAAGAAAEVAFAAPHLQILFGEELTPDYEVVQIGEVIRDPAGALAWAHDFVPPCSRIGASASLMASLRSLLATLTARQRHLAALCKHRRSATHALQVTELLQFNHLAAVRASLPIVDELVSSPETSPRAACLLLKQAAGHLSILLGDDELPPWPVFQLLDLRATFAGLFDILQHTLGGSAARPYETIALLRRGDGTFACKLPTTLLGRATVRWLLSVRPDVPIDGLAERWAKLAKVAAAADLQQLIRSAAVGVPLTAVDRPPASVPWFPDTAYFALDTQDWAWERAVEEGSVGVFVPAGIAPAANGSTALQVSLLAVGESSA